MNEHKQLTLGNSPLLQISRSACTLKAEYTPLILAQLAKVVNFIGGFTAFYAFSFYGISNNIAQRSPPLFTNWFWYQCHHWSSSLILKFAWVIWVFVGSFCLFMTQAIVITLSSYYPSIVNKLPIHSVFCILIFPFPIWCFRAWSFALIINL